MAPFHAGEPPPAAADVVDTAPVGCAAVTPVRLNLLAGWAQMVDLAAASSGQPDYTQEPCSQPAW